MKATYPPLTSNAGTVHTTDALPAAPPVISNCLRALNRAASRFPGETAPVSVTVLLALPRVTVAGHETRMDSAVQLSVSSWTDEQPTDSTVNAMRAESAIRRREIFRAREARESSGSADNIPA